MNPSDSKKMEEIEARLKRGYMRVGDREGVDVQWLLSRGKEQDREIEHLRKEHAGLLGSECGLMARAKEQDREIAELRVRLPCTDAPWTLKELDDAKKLIIEQILEIERLQEALFDHRADLHCYSSRPCPTCRNSAEVLGIADKVPYCCAREETDSKARRLLAEKEKGE